MNKGITILAILVIIVLAGILLYAGGDTQSGDRASTDGNGVVYFAVTDAAADMGNVTEVTMTTDNVELHSESTGWVAAEETEKSFNLLQLKASNSAQLWTAASVPAETYERVRLTIDDVRVTTQNGAESEAALPSRTVTVSGNVNVQANATSSATFDVLADQSLHTTTEGEYVFAPVVQMESRSGTKVSVNDDNVVTVEGGTVDSNITVGVDLSGNSVEGGAQVSPSETITVTRDGSGGVSIEAGAGGSGTSSVQTDGSATSGTSVEANTEADGEAGGGSNEAGAEAEGSVDVEGGVDVQN